MISIVVPAKDEQETLALLGAEVLEVVERERLDAELIFVDDGSVDDSWNEILRLTERDARIRGVRLRRNFGKAAALSAGFAHARGELIFTLDADLQDDPHEIPRFLALMEQGWDLVSGWKKVRHDPWHKVWPSRLFNRLIGWATGLRLHDHVCGFKCLRASVAREVALYGEMHRFLAVRAFARGFRVTEIDVHHRPREHGRSKYGASRFIKGFLDLLTVWFTFRFGNRPAHFFGTVGLLHLAGAAALALVGAAAALLTGLLGLLWMAAGLSAEWTLAAQPPRTLQYSIAEVAGTTARVQGPAPSSESGSRA